MYYSTSFALWWWEKILTPAFFLLFRLLCPTFSFADVDTYVIGQFLVGRGFVSDFDLMIAKKKDESSRKRNRRRNFEVINDSDDIIAELIGKMKEAASVSSQPVIRLNESCFCKL